MVRSNSKAPSPVEIEILRLGLGGGEQFHLMLVERVDQGDEARRLVAILRAHFRDADKDDGVEMAGDREIIARAPRLAAQPLEGEDGDALQALRHVQGASARQLQLSVGTLALSSTG